eukprot:2962621-Pleurochrysis_carterae.AAC.1
MGQRKALNNMRLESGRTDTIFEQLPCLFPPVYVCIVAHQSIRFGRRGTAAPAPARRASGPQPQDGPGRVRLRLTLQIHTSRALSLSSAISCAAWILTRHAYTPCFLCLRIEGNYASAVQGDKCGDESLYLPGGGRLMG